MTSTPLQIATPLFEFREVTFRYDQVTALENVSLAFQKNCCYALLGPNGSGKSTLLRLLDALDHPSSGEVFFSGSPLTKDRLQDWNFSTEFRRRVALVFQNPDIQLFSATVFDELAFGPLQLRWPPEEIRRRVAETLETMEIAHLKDRAPHHLSIGEKKRVALASVLILDPEILLLDEPTASLDPRSESRMFDFLVNCRRGSKTIITATHDLAIVRDIADRCVIFQSGRLVAEGEPNQLLNDIPLLERAHLIHSHRHTHASGEAHSHLHIHDR